MLLENANLFNLINLRFSGNLDPYALDPITGATINESYYNETGSLARLTQANVSIGFKMGNAKKIKAAAERNKNSAWVLAAIPWSLDVSYSFNYTKIRLNPVSPKTIRKPSGNLQLNREI